jgi:hypothetical protein
MRRSLKGKFFWSIGPRRSSFSEALYENALGEYNEPVSSLMYLCFASWEKVNLPSSFCLHLYAH